jgi:hypothetical protein
MQFKDCLRENGKPSYFIIWLQPAAKMLLPVAKQVLLTNSLKSGWSGNIVMTL